MLYVAVFLRVFFKTFIALFLSQEKDETDSGYRSGTIPDEKLPRKPSQATLNREDLKKRIAEFNKASPGANFALVRMANVLY